MLEPEQNEFTPDWFSKPADTLLGLMNRREVPVAAVADAVDGGMETLRGLIKGTLVIDDDLAQSLSTAVGGSPTFWLKRQASYARALELALQRAVGEREEWLERVPVPGGKSRGRKSESQKVVELRERLAFYGVSSLRAWDARYGHIRSGTQFRTSQTFSSKDGAVSLWLRTGELEAALMTTARWDPSKLRMQLDDMLKLSKVRKPERFLPKLKALGAVAGVAIAVVRAPDGCKASGASRLVAPDKAMVLLSFRHLSDDHFWFTLLHELGHLLLHGANPFVDADDTYPDDCEREANEFACSCIIPPTRWEEFANLGFDKESVMRLGVSLGIAPGLIVGQLQYRRSIPRDRLNYLKRRWTWTDIDAALT